MSADPVLWKVLRMFRTPTGGGEIPHWQRTSWASRAQRGEAMSLGHIVSCRGASEGKLGEAGALWRLCRQGLR